MLNYDFIDEDLFLELAERLQVHHPSLNTVYGRRYLNLLVRPGTDRFAVRSAIYGAIEIAEELGTLENQKVLNCIAYEKGDDIEQILNEKYPKS